MEPTPATPLPKKDRPAYTDVQLTTLIQPMLETFAGVLQKCATADDAAVLLGSVAGLLEQSIINYVRAGGGDRLTQLTNATRAINSVFSQVDNNVHAVIIHRSKCSYEDKEGNRKEFFQTPALDPLASGAAHPQGE